MAANKPWNKIEVLRRALQARGKRKPSHFVCSGWWKKSNVWSRSTAISFNSVTRPFCLHKPYYSTLSLINLAMTHWAFIGQTSRKESIHQLYYDHCPPSNPRPKRNPLNAVRVRGKSTVICGKQNPPCIKKVFFLDCRDLRLQPASVTISSHFPEGTSTNFSFFHIIPTTVDKKKVLEARRSRNCTKFCRRGQLTVEKNNNKKTSMLL